MSYQYPSEAKKRKRSQKEEFLSNYAKHSSILNWTKPNTGATSSNIRSRTAGTSSAADSTSSLHDTETINAQTTTITGPSESSEANNAIASTSTFAPATIDVDVEPSESVSLTSEETSLNEIRIVSVDEAMSPSHSINKSQDLAAEHQRNAISSNTLLKDIGKYEETVLSEKDMEFCLKNTPYPFPSVLPPDYKGYKFQKNIQSVTLANGKKNDCTNLVWSTSKNALFCLPCRIFNKNAERINPH